MIPQKHRILYEKRNLPEWEQVLQILDDNHIPFTVQNSGMQDLFGSAGIEASYLSATGSPSILVAEKDYAAAADLLLEIVAPRKRNAALEEIPVESDEEDTLGKELLDANKDSKKMLAGLILTVLWAGGITNILAIVLFIKMIKKFRYLGITALILNVLILFFTFRWYLTLAGFFLP
jgi:hypothetical protein